MLYAADVTLAGRCMAARLVNKCSPRVDVRLSLCAAEAKTYTTAARNASSSYGHRVEDHQQRWVRYSTSPRCALMWLPLAELCAVRVRMFNHLGCDFHL
jgi:hypothetical protein